MKISKNISYKITLFVLYTITYIHSMYIKFIGRLFMTKDIRNEIIKNNVQGFPRLFALCLIPEAIIVDLFFIFPCYQLIKIFEKREQNDKD